MVTNILRDIALAVAAIVAAVFAIKTKSKAKKEKVIHEKTIKVLKELRANDRNGSVRDRMSRWTRD